MAASDHSVSRRPVDRLSLVSADLYCDCDVEGASQTLAPISETGL